MALTMIFEAELHTEPYWPTRQKRPARPEELPLRELVEIACGANWLPARYKRDDAPDDYITKGEIGDAVQFVIDIRNVAAHPGKLVRELSERLLGKAEYQAAYVIVRATFDYTHAVLERMREEDSRMAGAVPGQC